MPEVRCLGPTWVPVDSPKILSKHIFALYSADVHRYGCIHIYIYMCEFKYATKGESSPDNFCKRCTDVEQTIVATCNLLYAY